MNKILRYSFLMLLTLVGAAAQAEEVTIDLAAQGFTNAQEVTSITSGDITVTFDKGTGTNAPKYYTAGTAVRVYGGSSFTVSTLQTITKVVFTYAAANYAPAAADMVNGGTLEGAGAAEQTWMGSSSAVTLTRPSGTGQWRLQKLVVTYDRTNANAVQAPAISGSDLFVGSTDVTIVAEGGATVHYTTDGSAPTASSTTYTGPITIKGTTTVKAVAVNGGNVSGVVEKTFTAASTVEDINEFKALASGTVAQLTLSNAQVLYADDTNRNVYVKDASGAICFYNAGLGLKTGDVLNGTVVGTMSLYNNLPQLAKNTLTNDEAITKTTGATPVAAAVTVAEAGTAKYLCDLVTISGVKLDSVDKNLYAYDADGNQIQVYDQFKLFASDKVVKGSENNTVTGIVVVYKNTYEIYPTTIEGITTTGIAGAVIDKNAAGKDEIYTISGQRVDATYKGIVIRNGKKYVQR